MEEVSCSTPRIMFSNPIVFVLNTHLPVFMSVLVATASVNSLNTGVPVFMSVLVATASVNSSNTGVPCGNCTCCDKVINCSGRGLTSVPSGLPKDAKSLNLSYNSLSDIPGTVFTEYKSLQVLDLSYNCLSSLNVDVFVGLESLQRLNLSWNNLLLSDDVYPSGVFSPLNGSLVDLRLNGNTNTSGAYNLTYPDSALSSLTSLQTLYIDGLPDVNFGPGFASLTNLTTLNVLGLDVGFCDLTNLTNETFVSLPQSLTLLNLSDCHLSLVEADAFRPLRNLNTLDLSYNIQLSFHKLGNAFYSLQGSALRTLYVDSIIHPYAVCVIIQPEDTRYLKNTSITTIYARYNRIEIFGMSALDNMPDSLQYVYVSGNRFSFGNYFQDFHKLSNLVSIENDGSFQAQAPPTKYPSSPFVDCSQGKCRGPVEMILESSLPMAMSARDMSLKAPSSIVYTLPPKLEKYVSRWNQLHYQLLKIEFDENNRLHTLDLSNNLLSMWIGPIQGLHNLTVLNLGNNIANVFSLDFFKTFPSLINLNVERNYLRCKVEADENGTLFEPLNKVEILQLNENHINKIPSSIFKGLTNLKVLNMSHNEIDLFEVNISHMQNLRCIDLSYNHIKRLPVSIMDHLDFVAERIVPENVTVNITFNPISCTCKNVDFLSWMHNSKIVFPHGHYSCLMADGSIKKMDDLNIFIVISELQTSCAEFGGLLVGIIICCFCLIVVIVSAVIYRFRWKLRYLYYASRLAYRPVLEEDARHFQYDAFVSYATEDHDFVHSQLVQRLETRAGLRLNVHNRDFIPGRPIPSNIVSAVHNSRRVLVVLTQHLLESDWCEYEMQMATMESGHTERDILLFLLYEDIPERVMSRQVLYNLQSSTYIQFPHDAPDRLEDFWRRLEQAIRD